LFQVIEKAKDERRIQISNREVSRRLLRRSLRKRNQKTESISIGSDGMRAGAALPNESVGKVSLQQFGEGGLDFHARRRLSARWHRSVASFKSSGAAERYQYVWRT